MPAVVVEGKRGGVHRAPQRRARSARDRRTRLAAPQGRAAAPRARWPPSVCCAGTPPGSCATRRRAAAAAPGRRRRGDRARRHPHRLRLREGRGGAVRDGVVDLALARPGDDPAAVRECLERLLRREARSDLIREAEPVGARARRAQRSSLAVATSAAAGVPVRRRACCRSPGASCSHPGDAARDRRTRGGSPARDGARRRLLASRRARRSGVSRRTRLAAAKRPHPAHLSAGAQARRSPVTSRYSRSCRTLVRPPGNRSTRRHGAPPAWAERLGERARRAVVGREELPSRPRPRAPAGATRASRRPARTTRRAAPRRAPARPRRTGSRAAAPAGRAP